MNGAADVVPVELAGLDLTASMFVSVFSVFGRIDRSMGQACRDPFVAGPAYDIDCKRSCRGFEELEDLALCGSELEWQSFRLVWGAARVHGPVGVGFGSEE